MKTVISVKTDQETKIKAQAVAKSIGIPLSTLVNAYLRELTVTGAVHFTAPEVATAKTEKIMEQIEKDIAAGDVSPAFDNLEDAFAWLDRKR